MHYVKICGCYEDPIQNSILLGFGLFILTSSGLLRTSRTALPSIFYPAELSLDKRYSYKLRDNKSLINGR